MISTVGCDKPFPQLLYMLIVSEVLSTEASYVWSTCGLCVDYAPFPAFKFPSPDLTPHVCLVLSRFQDLSHRKDILFILTCYKLICCLPWVFEL